MDYPLALRLKECGFPQGLQIVNGLTGAIPIKYPTLEEVLEALGDKTVSITNLGQGDKKWEATRIRLDALGMPQLANLMKSGSTPLLACCNLYIALNGK